MPGVSKLICRSLIERGKWTKDLCYFCFVKNKLHCSNRPDKQLIKEVDDLFAEVAENNKRAQDLINQKELAKK